MLACRHYVITGEATPYYIFHPHAPRRIKKLFPHAKIIMMLRNPVDRAYSHYRYHVKLGVENLTFEKAIEAESVRLRGKLERMLIDPHYNSTNYKVFSYLKRGIYIEQIMRWYELFPGEQILIIKSEEFFANPEQCFHKVEDFLGLPRYSLKTYKKFNIGKNAVMRKDIRERLARYFIPYNQRLYEFLGKNFDWDRQFEAASFDYHGDPSEKIAPLQVRCDDISVMQGEIAFSEQQDRLSDGDQ